MFEKEERKLYAIAEKILKALGERPASLDILLLEEREMKRLKWRLLKKRTEPNVLSFPEPKRFPHPEVKKRDLGEVYLNGEILRKDPGRATPLLLHGILHLLGYDHVNKAVAARMERTEERTLALLDSR
jgi:probable rRNA maturation factor